MGLLVDYRNLTNKEDAFASVKRVITPATLEKFKADIYVDEENKIITGTGTGFKLDLIFLDDAVDIKLDLSFLLKPFKGKVMDTIERMVKRAV